MNLPPEPGSIQPAERSGGFSGTSVMVRILDATKKLITITDHLKALEKEDSRLQSQVQELGRLTLDLIKEVRELSGQMKGIEKRFDDNARMVEALIKLRVAEEIEKAFSKFTVIPQPPKSPKKSETAAARGLVQSS